MNLLTCRDGEKLWDLGMRKHLQPALKGVHCIIGTEYRGFLWGVFVLPTQDKNEHPPFVWGRIASDGSEQFEPLPRPDGLPSEGFGTDSFFFPSPDQSGLFVSDGAALIYLRFGEP